MFYILFIYYALFFRDIVYTITVRIIMKIYGKDTLNFSLLISSLSTFPSSYITLSHSPYTLKLYAKEVFIS